MDKNLDQNKKIIIHDITEFKESLEIRNKLIRLKTTIEISLESLGGDGVLVKNEQILIELETIIEKYSKAIINFENAYYEGF